MFILPVVWAIGCWLIALGPQPTAYGQQAGSAKIRFNFQGATFEQVIDFFSRATNRPVVWQSPAPEGTLDYVSPDGYEPAEALRILNIILQSKGVMLRVSDDMLYLQKLTEMQKQDIPTFIGQLPDQITSDQVITVVRPLNIALAKPIAEKLAGMVGAYGSVTAMEQQNALVITETAANVRRLLTIINQLDMEDPEGAVEIFAIRNAKASEILVPLKALLSQRVEKFVINQQGQQVKIEEDRMPGLTISSDDRTNSIIAKGQNSKIEKLRETIALLDVPATSQTWSGKRSMTTIALVRITPGEAVSKLNQVFSKLPEKERPVILSLDDTAKVVIIGDDGCVDEGAMLLAELDGAPMNGTPNGNSGDDASSSNGSGGAMIVESIALSRAQPQQVIAALNGLMTKRQQSVCKVLPGTDGKSIVISGFSGDVKAIKNLVPVLDRQSAQSKQVRLLKINAPIPNHLNASAPPSTVAPPLPDHAATSSTQNKSSIAVNSVADILHQAMRLFDLQRDKEDQSGMWDLAVELDAASRTVTAVGSPRALDVFTNTLRMVEANVVVEREARQVRVVNVWPSEIVGTLQSLAMPMLRSADGRAFVEPTFAAVDQLNAIVVTATTEQFAVIESLISSLDSKSVTASTVPAVRVLSLHPPARGGSDATTIANLLNQQYGQRSSAERRARPVNVVADAQTNSLLVAAHEDVLPQVQAFVDELNRTERLDLHAREVRVFPLKSARAESLAGLMQQLLEGLDVAGMTAAAQPQRGRQPQAMPGRDAVKVAAEPRLNALIISAPAVAIEFAQQVISQLDVDPHALGGPAAARSVRVLAVNNADAGTLAGNLNSIFADDPQLDARTRPVIKFDSSSNSLIVRGTDEQFEVIQQVVERIDKASIASSRQMRTIQIDSSKSSAQDVARALQRMIGESGSGASVKVMSLEELMQQKTGNEKDQNGG